MKTKFFLVSVLVFLQLLGAAELSVPELVKKMRAQREAINSYSAEVVNVIEGALVQGKKTEEGKIFFQAPDKIRSETSGEPRQITLTVSGKTFLIDKTGQAVEIEKEKSSLDKQFSDPLELLNRFNFVITESDPETIKLIGTPKSSNEKELLSSRYFSKVIFYIDAKKYLTKEIRIHDRRGAELADIITEYLPMAGVDFPAKTITKLNFGNSNFRVTTSYRNIVLNQNIDPAIFDLAKIKAELKTAGGIGQ